MAIQVRRGNESDFDASKMLPGEWAVSLDTKYVRMCFAPGIVLRMSTYDAFEADMAQIQAILAECRNIQSAVQRIQTEVNAKASLTVEYANDAKESADRAYSEAERAKTYADNAEAVTGVQIATKERAGLIKGGNNHIAEDGTLMLITETTSTTQPNSYAGREHILEIGGVTEQGENPSPTNPQEIKKSVVSGVKTHGKNFLKNDVLTEVTTMYGVTFTPNTDGSITANGTALQWFPQPINQQLQLTHGREYIFSGCPSGGGYYTYYMYIEIKLAVGGSVVYRDEGNGVTFTYPTNATEAYIAIALNENISASNLVFKPMIREVGTEATFEQYTETAITFSKPIELYGKDGVRDVIAPKEIERKWHEITPIVRAIAQITGGYRLTCSTDSAIGLPLSYCLSTHFVHHPDWDVINCCCASGSGGDIYMQIPDSLGITTVDGAKEWIQANGVKVAYQLATPITEPLPIADQIGLNSLLTYGGITYVEFIYDELEPTFKGKYGTSEVGGMTIESLLTARNNELRLTAVENAVVNNI